MRGIKKTAKLNKGKYKKMKKKMNKKEILEAIKTLSKGQGFYCRVLEQVKTKPSLLKELEKQGFKDVVDMVLFLEC